MDCKEKGLVEQIKDSFGREANENKRIFERISLLSTRISTTKTRAKWGNRNLSKWETMDHRGAETSGGCGWNASMSDFLAKIGSCCCLFSLSILSVEEVALKTDG